MWRRLADRTLARRGLPLGRISEVQPFRYRRLRRPAPALADVSCVIPFWESDREELPYRCSRPSAQREERLLPLAGGSRFVQSLDEATFDQLSFAVSADGPVAGTVRIEVRRDPSGSMAVAEQRVDAERPLMKFIHFDLEPPAGPARRADLAVSFQPDRGSLPLRLHTFPEEDGGPALLMRLFRNSPGFSRRQLERCLASLVKTGIPPEALHVVARRQSSAANKNEGFRRVATPLVCFVDDDVEVLDADVFEILLDRLERNGADLVGPKIVDRSGRIFCADPWFDAALFPKPRGLGEDDQGQYDYTSEVPWLPSTFSWRGGRPCCRPAASTRVIRAVKWRTWTSVSRRGCGISAAATSERRRWSI